MRLHPAFRPALFATVVATSLLSAQAFAGVVVVVKSYTGADRKSDAVVGQMVVDGNKIRIEGTKDADAGAAMIFRGDAKELINLAPDKKKAMVIDVDSIAAFGTFQKQIEAQMEAAIAASPPEQQGQMRQMMKEQMDKMNAPPPARKLVKTSETKTINGVATVRYDMFKGETKVREIFIAPVDKISGGKELLGSMRAMAAFLEEVGKKVPGGNKSEAPFEALLDVEGIPMLTRHLKNGVVAGEEEIQSTKVVAVGADKFAIPAGYTRETLADAIKGRHGQGMAPGHGGMGK